MITLDLEGHRCPTAMILARRTIREVLSEKLPLDNDGLIGIQTIEPSFGRDLPLFLTSQAPNFEIIDVMSGDISKETIQKWTKSLKFDREEWEGQKQFCYIIKVISK